MQDCNDTKYTQGTRPVPETDITVPQERVSLFFPLLAAGFRLAVETGRSLRDVLCRQLGLDAQYVESQVQTFFLNGRAVDDIDKALVADGAEIALSAAMPGLVGAVFRKGGKLSSFRTDIKEKQINDGTCKNRGSIRLRLFNQVAADLGPGFLASGILLETLVWKLFLSRYADTITAIFHESTPNPIPLDIRTQTNTLPESVAILLKVRQADII